MSDSTSNRFSCVTDYKHLYGIGYYGHSAGVSSFHFAAIPSLVASYVRRFRARGILDFGGGSGFLGKALDHYGVKSFTADAMDRDDLNYLKFDASIHNEAETDRLKNATLKAIGGRYILTCFDVAEHIDPEHVADFVLNLARLIEEYGIISISTRPSSLGNRFHCSVFPKKTWEIIFSLARLDVKDLNDFNLLRSTTIFSESSENLGAVSHWQRANPFKDHVAHQHYFMLTRTSSAWLDRDDFRRKTLRLLDLEYRQLKRVAHTRHSFPHTLFLINFIQDWSFARSLMDNWPTERFHLLLRSDLIARQFLDVLKNYLHRVNVAYEVIGTTREGMRALDKFGIGPESLFLCATEGLVSTTHLLGSMIVLEARKRGATTVCLQHGMNVPDNFAPASEFFGSWEPLMADKINVGSNNDFLKAVEIGSPKFGDAIMPQSPNVLSIRLGVDTNIFYRSVMVGLNLHWTVHKYGRGETYAWLRRLISNNPETFFIIRPHPDDSSIYFEMPLFSWRNVLIYDEMVLLALDWPISRLVNAVDGVITTYSTLALDAIAAGKTPVLLDWEGIGQMLPTSLPLEAGENFVVLSKDDWLGGALPTEMFRLKSAQHPYFFQSARFLENLLSLRGRHAEVADIRRLETRVARSIMQASYDLNLDNHPHQDRARVTESLSSFVREVSDGACERV